MNDMNLFKLEARRAIFKMMLQYCLPSENEDGTWYMYNYCESALEAAFNILGIEDNVIDLMDFCKLWEENERAIWKYHNPNMEEFLGCDAQFYYDYFVGNYKGYWKRLDEECEELALLDKYEEENKKLQKFKSYFDSLYGCNLEVLGWHQNGDTITFDEFYESAIEEMRGNNE